MDVFATRPLTPEVLDALAHVVAAALDDGDDARAWALTRTLEKRSGVGGDAAQPAGPVIGRRFAMAHRHLLGRASIASSPGTRPSEGRSTSEVVAHAPAAGPLPAAHPAG